MLSAAVYARKRLFVKQADHMVFLCNPLHKLHRKLVMVRRDIGCCKNRRQFVLSGSNLVMLGLRQYSELPKLLVKLFHKRLNAALNRSEIVILKLLTLRRLCAEKGTSGENQILALFINVRINQKILLLRTDRCFYRLNVCFSEQSENPERLTVDSLHTAQQRSLFIKRLAAV